MASDALLANLQPIAPPAEGEMVGQLLSPQAGPAHWGRANLSAYDPRTIAAGPFPTGPLPPTSLGLGTPPVLENARALVDEADDPHDIDPFVRFNGADDDVQVSVHQDGPGAAPP